MEIKKIGMYITATTLSFSLLASPAFAETAPNENERAHQVEIRVASTDNVVSKSELIKKFKQLFPGKYDFLKDGDFNLSNAHYYSDDETIRYELSFHKSLSGNRYIYGSVVFAGDNLDIEHMFIDPVDTKDALFPAKISKEEAKNIATKFIGKFTSTKNYQLQEDLFNYYWDSQLLTEPVHYSFSFVRTENGIPIPDQTINVTVLGNGDIIQMYRSEYKKTTFDDYSKVKNKEDMLNQIKNNLSVQLQYLVDYDYVTGEKKVELIYAPSIQDGVNALTGQWVVGSEFKANLPATKKIEMLTNKPLPAKQSGITVEQAKTFAEKILKIDSKNVKLIIESVEDTTYDEKEVYEVSFMYEYGSGGYGTSLTIDKNTGELIDYHSIKEDVLRDIGEYQKNKRTISKEQALLKAIDYLKQYAPSKLQHYAKPIEEPIIEEWNGGGYVFTFPRVVNGIPVVGDELHVTINKYGELRSLNVNSSDTIDWPQIDQVVSEDEAKNKIINALNVELNYKKVGEKPHYYLVYSPVYNGNAYSYFDAISGEWKTPSYIQEPVNEEGIKVSHPTAEKELNYFIENGYLEILDVDNFNPDTPITKGEVINALVNSLTYYGWGYYEEEEEDVKQTFENIGPDHPYYGVVEQAVSMGILNPNHPFDPESTITREELAVWFINILGLEGTAKNADIFKLNVQDVNDVNENYVGYVALANKFGLISAENGKFNPKGEVTYAEFVISTVHLAHKANEMNIQF